MFHIFIFDSVYNKEFIQYLVSLDGDVVLANYGMPGPVRDIIYQVFFSFVCQKLELMYQKSCLRHNVKIKDNIFDKQLPLHK